MIKKFKVVGKVSAFKPTDLRAAFGYCMARGELTEAEAQARFDVLDVGETLVDEDGDTWERVE